MVRLNRVRNGSWVFGGLIFSLCAGCTEDTLDGQSSTLTVFDASVVATRGAGDTFAAQDAVVTLDCPAAVVQGARVSGFAARVVDGSGQAAPPGYFVQLMPSEGTVRAESTGGGHTDRDGEVAFEFNAPRLNIDAPVSIDAALADDQGRGTARDSCTVQVVSQPVRVAQPQASATVPYGQSLQVRLDVLGTGLLQDCEAGGGIELSLQGPADATLQEREDGVGNRSLCLSASDEGLLSFWVHGGDSGGQLEVDIDYSGYRTALPLTAIGRPAEAQLQAELQDLKLHEATELRARVVDGEGRPVAGVTVEFNLARCAEILCAEGEAVEPAEVVTGSDGVALSAYFAGETPGAARIEIAVREASRVRASTFIRVD